MHLSTQDAARRQYLYAGLYLIVAAALGLRLWGIWFGLPYSFRADEYHEVFRALELGTGRFNFDRTGKGGYFYLLFFEYGLIFVGLKIAGIVNSAQDFARYFVSDPSIFYLVSRATTAVIGTINVILAWRLGMRAYGFAAGVLAAAFLTVDFLNAEHSHYITVDVPMTCLATAALLFAVRMVQDGRAADYRWAALFAALATTTKLPAILLLVPLLIAHFYVVRRQQRPVRAFFLSPDLWIAAGIFIVVLAVTNPGLFMSSPLDRLAVFGVGEDAALVDEEAEEMQGLPTPNLFAFYFFTIADSMGWTLFAVALAGLLYALWRRTPADVMLVAFAAVMYVVFSSTTTHLYFPRYILPVIVVLAILAGRVVAAFWPAGAGKPAQAAAVAVLAALFWLPLSKTVAHNHLLTQADTRALAKEWFEENVPQGSKVMIEGLKVEPSRLTVPLRDTPEKMRENIEYYAEREPGKAIYLKYLLQVENGRTYDLELVKRTELESLERYKEKGVQYLVIRPETFANSRRMGLTGRDFLDEIREDPDVRLLRSFDGDPRSRPGPDIDVYVIDAEQRAPAG